MLKKFIFVLAIVVVLIYVAYDKIYVSNKSNTQTTIIEFNMPAPYNADADITTEDKTIPLANGSTVTVSVERPIATMTPIDFTFNFSNKSHIANVTYSTNMDMNMGNFKKSFKANDDFVADMILPRCGSGRTLWYGKLVITYTNESTEDVYFFYNTAK